MNLIQKQPAKNFPNYTALRKIKRFKCTATLHPRLESTKEENNKKILENKI